VRSVLKTKEQIFDAGKRLVARLEETPGVVAATPIESAPFNGRSLFIMKVAPADVAPSERDHYPFVPLEFVGPYYFRTFHMPMRRGRACGTADTEGTETVVVASLTTMLPALRAATRDANPDLTLYDATTMDQLLDQPSRCCCRESVCTASCRRRSGARRATSAFVCNSARRRARSPVSC
jgi:hypothetical protein